MNSTTSEPVNAPPADLVLLNGAIYTVNPAMPWAEAIAIQGDLIVYVGQTDGVEALIGQDTQVIDLAGRTVLPGLHDVHLHPMEAGSVVAGTCELPEEVRREEVIAILRDCAPEQIGTDWVLGWGHSIESLLELDENPIDILDEAIPDQPAIMLEQTSHSVWVNSAALAAAGIDASTPDPAGGLILRDPTTGEPNGILMDNAGNLLIDMAMAPTPELEDLHYEGLLYSLDLLAQNGITSISDARTYWGRNYHRVWQRAEDEGTLTTRTILGLWAYPHLEDEGQLASLTELYDNQPGSLLRISQIKVYSDGLIGNTTAAVFEPYLIDLGILDGNRGMQYFAEDRLTRYISQLTEVGFDFHIHGIGDRGVHAALNAIERAQAGLEARHRITHLELVDEEDIARFVELGVIADMQVAGEFTLPHFHGEMEPLIGDRAQNFIPARSLYDSGALVTLSSDWDVSELSPFIGMQHALQRDHQSLPDLATVIEAYTINGAYTMRQENLTGSLEVGKLADLIVIDQDLFSIPVGQIGETVVLLTMLGGEEIFRHPGSAP